MAAGVRRGPPAWPGHRASRKRMSPEPRRVGIPAPRGGHVARAFSAPPSPAPAWRTCSHVAPPCVAPAAGFSLAAPRAAASPTVGPPPAPCRSRRLPRHTRSLHAREQHRQHTAPTERPVAHTAHGTAARSSTRHLPPDPAHTHRISRSPWPPPLTGTDPSRAPQISRNLGLCCATTTAEAPPSGWRAPCGSHREARSVWQVLVSCRGVAITRATHR